MQDLVTSNFYHTCLVISSGISVSPSFTFSVVFAFSCSVEELSSREYDCSVSCECVCCELGVITLPRVGEGCSSLPKSSEQLVGRVITGSAPDATKRGYHFIASKAKKQTFFCLQSFSHNMGPEKFDLMAG